jgi:hypothetical protein
VPDVRAEHHLSLFRCRSRFFSPDEQKSEKGFNKLSIEMTRACKDVCGLALGSSHLLMRSRVGTPDRYLAE